MKFLPYDKFEIKTARSKDEIQAIVDAHVERPKWFWSSSNGKPFRGMLYQDGFKIMRVIHYRNSFLPIIRGTYRIEDQGVTIIIRMRLHLFIMAFLSIWFAGIFVGNAAVIALLVTNYSKPQPSMIIPFVLLPLGAFLVLGCFWAEAKKAEKQIVEMFQ